MEELVEVVNNWNAVEVMCLWRIGGEPFQGACIPRIGRRLLALACRVDDVDQEEQDADGQDE